MTKPSVHALCFLGVIVTTASSMGASYTRTVQSTAESEIARRQEYAGRAKAAIVAGDKAMKEKDYDVASTQYRTAVDFLPESSATHAMRERALDGFCVASVKLSEQRISEGRYADATNIAKLVLEDRYDPDCTQAKTLLAHLQDPDYFNKTITPKFHGNVDQVKQWFVDAKGYYDSGRYDLSMKRYEQILNLDPYNIAARKGEEEVNLARDTYARQAYNEHRSRMIWEVDKAWESPVHKYGRNEIIGPPVSTTSKNTDAIVAKLNRIIIPNIKFQDATVREAIDFLKQKSVTLDTTEADPTRRGVNIVLKTDSTPGSSAPAAAAIPAVPAIPGAADQAAAPAVAAAPAATSVSPSDARITLALTNIPLYEALRYITGLANLKIKVEPYAVSIVPLSEPTDVLVTKEYRVPPGFISVEASTTTAAASSLGPPTGAKGGGAEATGAGQNIGARKNARDFLEQNGVVFPPGASAVYITAGSRLIVRNTQEALDLIDTLVESQSPSQVTIESKFVEIEQTNLKELSFDTLLGQFSVAGPGQVFGGGGTSGNQGNINSADFPFTPPGGQTPVGGFPLSAGNRSGSSAIAADAINALLAPASGGTTLAPALFSLAGVFTQPQFQIVIRALNQKKGVDLLSSPSITTKSGQRATIEVIREFRYPTEFEPPQIPQNFGGGGGGNNLTGTAVVAVFPVTPTTPTAFETRNTGVTLEVDPTVGPDGYTIDLTLVPQVVEFEGFINYGSPIQTINPAALGLGSVVAAATGQSSSVVLTQNVINQPIFSTRKVTTSVTIWDGATVVLGGLVQENVQKVDDKVPLLGDLPLFGRLFRSSVDQHIKDNLIIFVTARLINPAGELIQQSDEEKEEVVEPTSLDTVAPPNLPESPLFKK